MPKSHPDDRGPDVDSSTDESAVEMCESHLKTRFLLETIMSKAEFSLRELNPAAFQRQIGKEMEVLKQDELRMNPDMDELALLSKIPELHEKAKETVIKRFLSASHDWHSLIYSTFDADIARKTAKEFSDVYGETEVQSVLAKLNDEMTVRNGNLNTSTLETVQHELADTQASVRAIMYKGFVQ